MRKYLRTTILLYTSVSMETVKLNIHLEYNSYTQPQLINGQSLELTVLCEMNFARILN